MSPESATSANQDSSKMDEMELNNNISSETTQSLRMKTLKNSKENNLEDQEEIVFIENEDTEDITKEKCELNIKDILTQEKTVKCYKIKEESQNELNKDTKEKDLCTKNIVIYEEICEGNDVQHTNENQPIVKEKRKLESKLTEPVFKYPHIEEENLCEEEEGSESSKEEDSVNDSRSSENSENISDSDSAGSLRLDLAQEERRASTSVLLEKKVRGPREARSMSDGADTIHLDENGDVAVFPSLQDNVLENLGLLGESPRQRLTEEEIESKFATLTLAFTIDSVTLAERRERQRRQRDQAETNMKKELDKLVISIHRLNPLCIDAEKTELVTSLLQQLCVVEQAAERISFSAEVLGSVQQEWRMAESCSLMLTHLRNLKRQRDTARRQVQCTKKMLQSSCVAPQTRNTRSVSVIPANSSSADNLLDTRRRASIATIQRLNSETRLVGGSLDSRRLTRRQSGEVSPRLWDQRRLDWSTQPSRRPTLGTDLSKIREGTVESTLNNNHEEHYDDLELEHNDIIAQEILEGHLSDLESLYDEDDSFKRKLLEAAFEVYSVIQHYWDIVPTEYLCVLAISTYTFFIILIGNLLIELEYTRKETQIDEVQIPFKWDEILNSARIENRN